MIDDSSEAGIRGVEPDSERSDGLRPERVRRSRRRKRRVNPFERWWMELLLLLSLAVGIGLILLWLSPSAIFGEGVTYGTFSRGRQNLLPQIGVILLLIGSLGGVMRLHHRVNYHEAWWVGVCPQCKQGELKRTHRNWLDRLLGALKIPVQRYVCGECRWEGARIDQSRI